MYPMIAQNQGPPITKNGRILPTTSHAQNGTHIFSEKIPMGIRPIVASIDSPTANISEFLKLLSPTNHETTTSVPKGYSTIH